MISISTKELQEFFGRGKHIKDNGILPIYAFIKIEAEKDGGRMTKTCGNAFVIHDIELDSKKKQSILIEERKLFTLVGKTPSTGTITITWTSTTGDDGSFDNYILDNGVDKIKGQSPHVSLFQEPPSIEKEKPVLFSSDVVNSLFISKTVAHKKENIKTWMSYVQIKSDGKKNSFIFGTTGVSFYYKSFDFVLPSMVLDQETCATLGAFGEMNYTSKDNYHFFDVGKSVFGFVHCQEYLAAPDITSIIALLDKKSNFIVSRKEIVDVCEISISINQGNLAPVLSITDAGKNKIMLKYENEEFASSNDRTFDVPKVGKVDEFLFMAEDMVTILKALSYEKIQFNGPVGLKKDNYFITTEEDPNYLGFIRAIIFQSPVVTATTKK